MQGPMYDSPYGQKNQYDQYGQFTQYGNQMAGQYGQYGAMNNAGNGNANRLGKDFTYIGTGKMQPRKRLNLIAIVLSFFIPWFTFCFVFAMLTFSMHYRQASTCKTISMVLGVVFGLLAVLGIFGLIRRWTSEEAALREAPSWLLFLSLTSIVALLLAVAAGDRNFWINMQPYYDITSLNSYQGIDPARMWGKEIMDAGRVKFVEGAHLDLSRAMGFKNQEVYCAAPITGGAVQGSPPLEAYDFWAVGKGCCSGNAGDFKCGAYDNAHARGGVRVVRDEDRAFYRLAVQQAQSVFNIRANHPLFFNWVEDPIEDVKELRQQGYKWYLEGMFLHFAFQLLLVAIAVCAFATRDWRHCCPSAI